MTLVKMNNCKGFAVFLKDQKWSGNGPLKKKVLYIFDNLKSGFWHFLRSGSKAKNKFRFSEDFW